MFREPQKDRSFWTVAGIMSITLLVGFIVAAALWVLIGLIPVSESATSWARACVIAAIVIMTVRRAVTRTLEFYSIWRWGKYGD